MAGEWGGHEGGETPFEVDVTKAVRRGRQNLVAVRVLNPTNEPIDGVVLGQTPHDNRRIPHKFGAAFNIGGITGPVELVIVPAVRGGGPVHSTGACQGRCADQHHRS